MFRLQAHAPAHPNTAYWGCCNNSTSQLQSLCEFLCDVYAEYGYHKKCEFRNIFPDAPVSHRYLHTLQIREKATGEMFDLNLQGESSSLCWLTKGKQCARVYRLNTTILSDIYIYISTTCFGPYGHRQVGYDIRGKTV